MSLAILAMFLLLLVNSNYLQAFEASDLMSKPDNIRASAASNKYERGSIVTSDGQPVAKTKPTANGSFYKFQRYYTNGPVYAPVTGYESLYNSTGIEHAEDGLLSGNGSQLAFRNFIDMITNKTQKGATVQLTVNSKAQQAAYDGLERILQGTDKIGGVVALNPTTGAILAMASFPSYDPNLLATHDGNKLNRLVGPNGSLLRQSPSPLTNQATQALLPPGSTFKIITSAAWFTQNSSRTTDTQVSSPQTLKLPQTTNILHNDHNEVCSPSGDNQATILHAFAKSCDTTFGQIGMELGGSTINAMAKQFGMNTQDLQIPGVATSPSGYVIPPSLPLTAYSAIGQYSDTSTALQEAMLSAAVANNGTLMRPYLVQQATASDLSTVQASTPSMLSQPMTPEVAGNLQKMMTAVVQNPEGTANAYNAANENGLVIAGKTGTAQTINGQKPDAVFTAYAPANGTPKIAVGVMIQAGGYGAAAAAPIAIDVINAYLASVGQQ